jgi:hypothetical protein
MKTLKEYRLKKDLIAPQTLYITKGARVVNLIDLGFDLSLIILCSSTETNTDLRTFKVCNLYEVIYYDNIEYVGNFDEGHVIEIL